MRTFLVALAFLAQLSVPSSPQSSGISNSKPLSKTFKVRGEVKGVNPADLRLLSASMNGERGADTMQFMTSIQENGTFEFPGVTPGRYAAFLIYNSNRQPAIEELSPGVAVVSVTNGDVENVEIFVRQIKKITGHVHLEGQGVMPRFYFPLTFTRISHDSVLELIPQRSLAVITSVKGDAIEINPKKDGTFETSIFDDEQSVGSPKGLPAGYVVKSLTYGTTDILKNPLNVEMSDNKEFVLSLSVQGSADR